MIRSSATLDSILWDRYTIREQFSVLGMFVTYPDYSRDAGDIVVLGMSSSYLMVARVVLSGHSVDYELVSMSPLHLLSLNVHDYKQKKLIVHSPYKVKSCIYQLCSCEDQDSVWEDFLHEIIGKSHGQTYFCPVYVDNKGYEIATIIPSDSKMLEAPTITRDKNNNSVQDMNNNSVQDMNNNSVQGMNNNSVPVYNLSTTDFVMGDYSPEIQTGLWDDSFEDVEFDSFVNDNDTPKLGDIDIPNQAPSNTKNESVLSRFKERMKKLFK